MLHAQTLLSSHRRWRRFGVLRRDTTGPRAGRLSGISEHPIGSSTHEVWPSVARYRTPTTSATGTGQPGWCRRPALGNVRRRAHPGRLLASAYRHVLCAPGPRTPEAERVGFEPTRPLRAHWFSRPAPSSTRPSLQAAVSHAEYGADYPATGMDFTPRRKKSGCHCRSSRSIVKCTSGILASN